MFKEISPYDITYNPFSRIGKDWTLITAGTEENHNTMTASWAQVGIMWNKPVATVFLRPQRHTLNYVEREERFSVSFFKPGAYKEELNLLGTQSGREVPDKIKKSGLHTVMIDGVPTFGEANLVLICRKLYKDAIKHDCFIDKSIDKENYPKSDYHVVFTAEIEKVYVK